MGEAFLIQLLVLVYLAKVERHKFEHHQFHFPFLEMIDLKFSYNQSIPYLEFGIVDVL